MIGSKCQMRAIAASVSGCVGCVANAFSAFKRVRHCMCKVTVELCGGDAFAEAGVTGSATKFRIPLGISAWQFCPRSYLACDLSVLGLYSVKATMDQSRLLHYAVVLPFYSTSTKLLCIRSYNVV